MGTVLSTMRNFLPYHLFSYGTLLGTEVFQSFVNTKVCYNNLSTREFLILQKRIFPIYFASQIGLAVLTAATHPPYGIISLVKDVWSVVPLGVVITMGSLNYFFYGPKTTKEAFIKNALKEKEKDQEDGPANADDRKADAARARPFKHNHAMSIHLNAIAIVATVCYGITLSSKVLTGNVVV